jgi:choline dehydrogenase
MEADFVIVGAGSAGSAMAARLSEDGRHSVIVIEHGGSDFGPVHPDAGGTLLPDEHGDL